MTRQRKWGPVSGQEREAIRRRKLQELAARDPAMLARVVIESGRIAGAWASTGDFARDVAGRDERTVRRWLSGKSRVPPGKVERLVEEGVRLGSQLLWSAAKALPLASVPG